ncbi:NADP-dependent oxidoreductase [Nonomuraea sp. NPDC049152]|uniref:NADP-dependent oxidoreductase n=1 Tax=Nonomuraea sp. NPDC049152 TaxID=3154350 RepID=UPI0034080444
MTPPHSQEVRLAARPSDDLTADHFSVVEAEVREPGPGEVLVRNDWMALAHVMSKLLRIEHTPEMPFATRPGDPLTSATVGTVIASQSTDLAVGDLVAHGYGWRGCVTSAAGEFARLERDLLPGAQYFLNAGPTAWRGMVEVARVSQGDTVFVSGAAGAVGSLAGQIARCQGAKRVIGSAGSKSKVDYLVGELGFDAAFDYHDGPVLDRLRELAPEGIDVFFDNVSGEQFEAAVQVAVPGARFALCGALSGRNPTLDLGPLGTRDLTIQGFSSSYDPADTHAWTKEFGRLLGQGRIAFPHTVVEGGPAAAPQALVSLLRGDYIGCVLVRLS